MQVQVLLRHCFYSPNTALRGHARPLWFDREKIFNNFLATIDPAVVDYTIVFDEYFGSIQETFLKGQSKVVTISAGNESSSFLQTLDLALDSGFSGDTIIYFLEDDYLHRPGWPKILLEAFTLPVDYVTLYDHRDKYVLAQYSNLKSHLFQTSSVHWRTTPSTTNSYAMKLEDLRRDRAIHKHYSASAQKGVTRDHEKFLYLGKCGRTLVSSVPGYSTHCDDMYSPIFDWESLIK